MYTGYGRPLLYGSVKRQAFTDIVNITQPFLTRQLSTNKMEQLSATTPAGSIFQSVLDLGMNTLEQGRETLSLWLRGTSYATESSQGGASLSQGGPAEPGFDASQTSAPAPATINAEVNERDAYHDRIAAANATVVVAAYRSRGTGVEPHRDQLNQVYVKLCRYQNTYLSQGKPRPQNLDLKALARACIAVNIRLSPKAFEFVCEELLEHQKLIANQVEQYLTDLGKGSCPEGLARLNKRLQENLPTFHKPSE